MGKTAFIRALRHGQGGSWAAGRFEPKHQELPYWGLRQALRTCLKRLIAQGEGSLHEWRERLQEALGVHVASLLEHLPELRHLLREVKDDSHLPLGESRHWLQSRYLALCRALSQGEPLFLALDDLQWADEATLQLLQRWFQDEVAGGLFWVLSWRSDPASEGLAFLESAALPGAHVELQPLGQEALAEWLLDTCSPSSTHAHRWARLLHRKTGGNPFFVDALLMEPKVRELLLEGASHEALSELPITGDVVALLGQRLLRHRELKPQIQLAACIGVAFGLGDLAALSECPEEALAPGLERCVEDGVFARSGELYRFAHPRLREVVEEELSPRRRRQLHAAIGLHMLKRGYDDSEELLRLLRHLQEGAGALPREQALTYARLALEAGQQARARLAIGAALRAFDWGLEQLGPEGWRRQYSLCLELATGIAHLARLTEEPPLARIEELLSHAKTLAEKVVAFEAKISIYCAQGRHQEALDVANGFLREARAPLIERRGPWMVLWEYLRVRRLLQGRTPEELLALPEARDPIERGIISIQVLVLPAYQALMPQVTPIMIMRDVQATLRYGATGVGSMCWTGYGAIVAYLFRDRELSERFGHLAMAQAERFDRLDMWPTTALFAHFVIFALHRPLAELLVPFKEICERSGEVGDYEAAQGAGLLLHHVHYVTGTPLDIQAHLSRRQEIHKEGSFSRIAEYFQGIWSRSVELLQQGGALSVEEFPSDDKAMGSGLMRALFFLHTDLVFGREARAFDFVMREQVYLFNPVANLFQGPVWTYSLVTLYLGKARGESLGWKGRSLLWLGQALLRSWVRRVPERRSFRLLWVRASRLRSLGRTSLAMEAYEDAFVQAQESGFSHDAALIAQHAAELCEGLGRWGLGLFYRKRALEGYRRWKAWRKVEAMEEEFPQLRSKGLPSLESSPAERPTPRESRPDRDLQVSLSAIQSFAQEQGIPFIEQFFPRLLESAHAQRGLFFAKESDGWRLVALAEGQEVEFPDVFFRLDQEHRQIPASLSMLRFVSLTRETLVLEDACYEGPFVDDPYVAGAGVRSACCIPLSHQKHLAGLLLLENGLLPRAFPEERLPLLEAMGLLLVLRPQKAGLSLRGAPGIPSTLGMPLQANGTVELSLSGRVLGPWTLLRCIGQGGMAVVYEARHLDGQRAAIKLLLATGDHSGQLRRFEREARTLQRMKHPNIVELLAFERDPELGHYLVMELLQGAPLSALLEACAPVPLSWLLDVSTQLCDALQAIHDAGIVHRDLKPSNVFVCDGDDGPLIKLLDFGVAKSSFHEKQTQLTSTGAIVGTPAYLSPEQLKEGAELTYATDLYALGVLWFEALTGQMPLSGGSNIELFLKILQSSPPPIGELRPELASSPMEELLMQLFSKQPRSRSPSALDALEQFEMACQCTEDPWESDESLQKLHQLYRASP